MAPSRGYALFETLLASLILASGLVGVSSIFSVTVGVNLRNQQRTVATLLLSDKMEQLRTANVLPGGGLDPAHPVIGFFEYVHAASDGSMIVDYSNTEARYLRLWQFQKSGPTTLTVAVFGRIGPSASLELARATSSW